MIAPRNDYDLVEGNEKSHLRNQKEQDTNGVLFFLLASAGFAPFRDLRQPQAAEGVGRQAKRLRWSVLAKPKPPNQGVEEATYDCAAQRL